MENDPVIHDSMAISPVTLTSDKQREPIPFLVKAAIGVLLIFCCFLLILSVILSSTHRSGHKCEDFADFPSQKTWTFAVAHHGVNIAYIDNRTGAISGYNVDVIKAVCKLANLDCDIVWDAEINCWDSSVGESPRGGIGLFNGWYDGCAGWIPTKARNRTFKFTKSYFNGPSEMLWTSKNDTTVTHLPINVRGKRIGFLDGWHSDEFCLQEQTNITGFNAETSTYIHYQSMEALVKAVNTNETDFAFSGGHPYLMKYLKPLTSSRVCASEGPAVMHRKDSKLSEWWNPALDKLLTSVQYKDICMDLKKAHGHIPGGDPSRVCLGDWNSNS